MKMILADVTANLFVINKSLYSLKTCYEEK